MIIEKLLIFDIVKEEANEFHFSQHANIIYSADNTSGKSCLLKSIYYALGLQIKNFASGWNYKDMVFKLYYSHKSDHGTILRYRDKFIVDGNANVLSEREYSEWLSDLLNIRIKLPRKNSDTLEHVVASAILSLFYIDQDTSWDKTPYKNTVNLGWYEAASIPRAIFEYVLGLKSSLNIDIADKISDLSRQKSSIDNQLNVLHELRSNFVAKDVVSEFDENKIKEEIKKYLECAEQMQSAIRSYKSKIYAERIKLDKYELEISELYKILDYNEKTYKKFSSVCPQCKSVLTDEQASERIKISNNVIEIKSDICELEEKAHESKQKINELLSQKINIDKEYSKLLSIAHAKQGELTLEQHLQNKSQEMSRSKYYKIKSNLFEQSIELGDKIKSLDSESRKLLISQQSKKAKIAQDFKNILVKFSLKFNKVNTDAKFLKFNQLSGSGADKNQKFIVFYMLYTKILIDHAKIELPFVLDSIVKDELDENVMEKSYKIVDEVLLSSGKQSFFAVLDDKLNLIDSKHNKIKIDAESRLLSKERYLELNSELQLISGQQ